jgi:hypothetical protein
MNKLLFPPDFYGVIIKLLLPEQSTKVNRMSKKVAWTAVSNRNNSLKSSGSTVLKEKVGNSSLLLCSQGKEEERACNKVI